MTTPKLCSIDLKKAYFIKRYAGTTSFSIRLKYLLSSSSRTVYFPSQLQQSAALTKMESFCVTTAQTFFHFNPASLPPSPPSSAAPFLKSHFKKIKQSPLAHRSRQFSLPSGTRNSNQFAASATPATADNVVADKLPADIIVTETPEPDSRVSFHFLLAEFYDLWCSPHFNLWDMIVLEFVGIWALRSCKLNEFLFINIFIGTFNFVLEFWFFFLFIWFTLTGEVECWGSWGGMRWLLQKSHQGVHETSKGNWEF